MMPVVMRTARMECLLSRWPKARLNIKTLISAVRRTNRTTVQSILLTISSTAGAMLTLDRLMAITERSTLKMAQTHISP